MSTDHPHPTRRPFDGSPSAPDGRGGDMAARRHLLDAQRESARADAVRGALAQRVRRIQTMLQDPCSRNP